MESNFGHAMKSLDNIAKNLAIGCQQETSNEIWNAIEQAKAAYVSDTNVVDIVGLIEVERSQISGIDGYNYNSGVEYGLRLAQKIIDEKVAEQLNKERTK